MSRIVDEDSARQLDRYRDGLRAKITALSAAVESLEASNADAAAAIRRIAHQLQVSSASVGLAEIGDAAALAERATEPHLAEATRTLIELLERASRPQSPAEILLVEDSPVLTELLTRALSSASCRIHAVKTAAQARLLLSERSYDLVILDLILPDEDGRNLLMFMQDRVRTAAVPVIVLSARGGTQTKTECLALGAEQFFEKPFDRVFLSAVANIIQRRRAMDSREDLLTGLPNRAEFRELFARALDKARQGQRPLALAMLDLDGFEAINQTYGHGEELLRRVGLFLYGELRHVDIVARWRSDEFAVVFPGHTAERAAGTLRGMQDTLHLQEGLPLADGRRILVTFSGGIVDVGPDEDLDAAMARADRLLYLAKATGRDRILDAVPEATTETRATILLVEAEAEVATLLEELLRDQGFEVTWRQDAHSALATAHEHHHDLAILDRTLPQMDGFELMARLRKLEAYRDVPVLVLTAMGSESDIERAFELGADDYVQKPFRHRELVARIRRLLKRTRRPAPACA